MADVQYVLQVDLVAARPRLGEAHVADPAGDLGQVLTGNFGVRLPGDTMVGEEAVQNGVVHSLPTDQVHGRLAQYAYVAADISGGHARGRNRGRGAREAASNKI